MRHIVESIKYHNAKGVYKSFEVVDRYDKSIGDETYEVVITRNSKGKYAAWDEDGKIQVYRVGAKSDFNSLEECKQFVDERFEAWNERRKSNG